MLFLGCFTCAAVAGLVVAVDSTASFRALVVAVIWLLFLLPGLLATFTLVPRSSRTRALILMFTLLPFTAVVMSVSRPVAWYVTRGSTCGSVTVYPDSANLLTAKSCFLTAFHHCEHRSLQFDVDTSGGSSGDLSIRPTTYGCDVEMMWVDGSQVTVWPFVATEHLSCTSVAIETGDLTLSGCSGDVQSAPIQLIQ